MGIILKPHNEVVYKKMLEQYKNSNKVAIVQPTGTGKSYIALKLIEDSLGEKAVYIAPSISILHNLKKQIFDSEMSMEDFSGLKRVTYQKLAKMSEEEIERELSGVKIIVTDEFHHCGAPEWGRGVETLISKNPNAKILGLSATPIRYSDGLKDMSDELFEGNVVSEYTLEEAIEQGILPEATYISAIYDYDKEELRSRIDKIENSEEKQELIREIDRSICNLSETLKKHMVQNGKYIVFCKNIEEMKQKIAQANEIFGQVNNNISIQGISSHQDVKENERIIQSFETNNNESQLKLLFAVNMLNEGYHINDLDGVIMMRPTFSPTIFTQQLGRALSVGNGKKPTIIDLVNNYESCKIVEDFCERMKQYQGRPSKEKDKRDSQRGLTIIDNAKDFRKIVSRIMDLSEEVLEFKIKRSSEALSEKEIINLENKIKQGDKLARKQLIESYLNFSYGIAEGFQERYYSILTVDIEDLKQIASLGVMKAVDSFDMSQFKNNEKEDFSNIFRKYMAETIYDSIMEEIKNTDEKSYDRILVFKEIYKVQVQLNKELGRFPTDEEILANSEISEKQLEQFRQLEGFKTEKVNDYLSYDESIEEDIIEKSSNGLSKIEKMVDAKITKEQMEQRIHEVLDTLSETEKEVIKMRYGIDDKNNTQLSNKDYEMTLSEIGKRLNVTSKASIGQKQIKAISRLRHPSRYRKLVGCCTYDGKLSSLSSELDNVMEGLSDYAEFYDEIMEISAKTKENMQNETNLKHIVNENSDYSISIYKLGFKTRTITKLRDSKIQTFGDILEYLDSEIRVNPTDKGYREVIDKVHDMGYITKGECDFISNINSLEQSNLEDKKIDDIKIEEIISEYNIKPQFNIIKNGIQTLEDILNMTSEELFVQSGSYYEKIIYGIHGRGFLLKDELNDIKKVSKIGKLSQDELDMLNKVIEYNERKRTEIQPLRDEEVLDGLIKKDLEKRELLQEAKELEQKYEKQLSMKKTKEFETNEKQGVDFDGE